MKVIYEPKGKAKEYSPLACNLYTGCSHACLYCYCPKILNKTLKEWSTNPTPRENILRSVERNAQKLYKDKSYF